MAEYEAERASVGQKIARLRALRLDKEAADKKAAEGVAAVKAAKLKREEEGVARAAARPTRARLAANVATQRGSRGAQRGGHEVRDAWEHDGCR
jgi:hypothetical protein